MTNKKTPDFNKMANVSKGTMDPDEMEELRAELERALSSGSLRIPGVGAGEVHEVRLAAMPDDAYVNPDLVEEFFAEVLDRDFSTMAFVSEDSTCFHFTQRSREEILEAIEDYYDVDVADIRDLNIWKVLRRIDDSE